MGLETNEGTIVQAEVTALFPAEPREAIGRSLQRLNRDGRVQSQGFRASTRYRAGAKP